MNRCVLPIFLNSRMLLQAATAAISVAEGASLCTKRPHLYGTGLQGAACGQTQKQ